MKKIIFLLLLLYAWSAVAVLLPPEIQTDLYFVSVEQKSQAKAYREAAEFMGKILSLQQQHPDEVKLPSEFYFNYAQMLVSACRYADAYEAIGSYLQAGGKKSEHYREALELLVKIKDILTITTDVNVNARDGSCETLLHGAARDNSSERVGELLEKKANVNARDKDGNTPLHVAAEADSPDAAGALLEKKANVNARDKDGNTPLHVAAEANSPDAAKVLLEKKANVNARDKDGNTPLHDAAWKNSLETAKILLEKGANVNARNKRGYTPLFYASKSLEIAKLLCQHGKKKNNDNMISYNHSNGCGGMYTDE